MSEFIQLILFFGIIAVFCVCIARMMIEVSVKSDKIFIFALESYIAGYLLVYPLCDFSVTAGLLSWFYNLAADIAGVVPPRSLSWLLADNPAIPRRAIAPYYMPFIPIFAVHMIVMSRDKLKAIFLVPLIMLVSVFLVMMSLSSLLKLLGWGVFAILLMSFLTGRSDISTRVPSKVMHNEFDGRKAYYLRDTYTKDGKQYATMSNEESTVYLLVGSDGNLYDHNGERFND